MERGRAATDVHAAPEGGAAVACDIDPRTPAIDECCMPAIAPEGGIVFDGAIHQSQRTGGVDAAAERGSSAKARGAVGAAGCVVLDRDPDECQGALVVHGA